MESLRRDNRTVHTIPEDGGVVGQQRRHEKKEGVDHNDLHTVWVEIRDGTLLVESVPG